MAKLYPKPLFLYLYLDGFLSTGGIQSFNRNLVNALQKIANQGYKSIRIMSLYDKDDSGAPTSRAVFKGYNQKRILFTIHSLWTSFHAKKVVIGHINLSVIAIVIKLINPKAHITMITHGIEVWGDLSLIQGIALRKVDRVLSVSEFTKQVIIQKHGVPSMRVEIFQNTLGYNFKQVPKNEASKEIRAHLNLPENSIILLTIARLASYETEKGYDKIIELLPELRVMHPNLHYVLAGSSTDAETSRLTQKINELGMQNYVHLPGYIDEQYLYTYFAGSDIFVMPSKKEGFGIVYIESMANGTPVIAGNRDGSTDAVSAYALGHLVNPDNKDEIKSTISKILTTEITSDAARVIEDFSFERFCERVELLTQ